MKTVIETIKDSVFTVTLNRPDKKNAMNSELLIDLYQSLTNAENSKASMVVIRGSGKTFCAGGDIFEFKESEEAGTLLNKMATDLHNSIKKIREIDAIVIAVVEGVVVGAGLGLALACDITVAEQNAVMNMAYRRIGLTPDGGGSFFLPRIGGAKLFSELYLLSRNVTMKEAQEIGLINFVYPQEELENRLTQLIDTLQKLPMETIHYFKQLVNASCYHGLEEHLDLERLYVSELGGKKQFKDRVESFFKKG